MPSFSDLASLLSFLATARGGPYEIAVACDTRDVEAKDYFRPFEELRNAWAGDNRLTLSIWRYKKEGIDRVWLKISLMRQLLRQTRSANIAFIVYLDSDATVCPWFEQCRDEDMYRQAPVKFTTLRDTWSRFVPDTDLNVCMLGYREAVPQARECPTGCNCSPLYALVSDRRGPTPSLIGHHSFNAGCFIVKAGSTAEQLFEAWGNLRPVGFNSHETQGWGNDSGYEQFEFDSKLAGATTWATHILLVSQHTFCPQSGSLTATVSATVPFVHMYGRAHQFTGKTLIGKWAKEVWNALSSANQERFPSLNAYVKDKQAAKDSGVAKAKKKARKRNTKAIVKTMGKPVRYKGKKYPSVGAAASATGKQKQEVKRSCTFI